MQPSSLDETCHEKTFILGLGVNFSGMANIQAAWESSGRADFGIRKCYRTLHSHDGNHGLGPKPKIFQSALESLISGSTDVSHDDDALLTSFVLNSTAYYDYFNHLLSVEEVTITGDCCPSYSSLSANIFLQVRSELAARSIRFLPILFLRNPIYRMHEEVLRKVRSANTPPTYPDFLQSARAFVGSQEDYIFTDYVEVIRKLRPFLGQDLKVVPAEAFGHTWAHEELENQLAIKVPLVPPKKPRRLMKTLGFTEEDYLDFQEAYADVFDAVDAEVGAFDIDLLWNFAS